MNYTVDESILEGTFYRSYSSKNNKHLLVLLPGQSMSSRAFWDFKLPDGKTHSEYFVEAGIDVILFDPIGYGSSTLFYSYDRVGYADQVITLISTISKDYITKAILGYSTSTSPALIAAEKSNFFNKVVLHSPAILRNTQIPALSSEERFYSNMEKLKSERIGKISDLLIPKPNRVDNWEESMNEINKTYTSYNNGTWSCPKSVVDDLYVFYTKHGNDGFNPQNIKANVLIIIGQYDFEMYTGANLHWTFRNLKSKFVSVPNSTHFSMWENNSHITRNNIIEFITE